MSCKTESTTNNSIIERNIVINGTHIRIKSIFSDNIPLEKALANIARRKLAESSKNDKS